MTPYRQNIINSYSYMISSMFILTKGAYILHMGLGIADVEHYLSTNEEAGRDMLYESDNMVVKSINAFIDDSEILLNELEERNQLDLSDMDHSDVSEQDEDENNKAVKVNNDIGFVIFLLTVNILNRIEKTIKALCEIKNEILPADLKSDWQFEDDNIQLISVCYRELSGFVEYLEKTTNSIDGKKNW